MDPSVCRDHIARLLSEETQALSELEQLLSQEHGALVAQDVSSLESTAELRRQRIGALLRIEDERRNLCRMLGHSTDPAGLQQLLSWCDSAGSLRSQWEDRGARAKRCRSLNDRNGALVTARLNRVESLIGLLTKKPDSPNTYGPKGGSKGGGAYNTASNTGRMLAIKA